MCPQKGYTCFHTVWRGIWPLYKYQSHNLVSALIRDVPNAWEQRRGGDNHTCPATGHRRRLLQMTRTLTAVLSSSQLFSLVWTVNRCQLGMATPMGMGFLHNLGFEAASAQASKISSICWRPVGSWSVLGTSLSCALASLSYSKGLDDLFFFLMWG